jgi:diphthamide biosynthesis enzyme Dph1/Dph2-like protein
MIRFANVQTLIMGDVTYGACCVDDYTAKALNCDFMIHYGHSCLVPVNMTTIKTLYVFVDIGFDISHFVESVKHNFGPKPLAKNSIQLESMEEEEDDKPKIALTGTVQFISSLPVKLFIC